MKKMNWEFLYSDYNLIALTVNVYYQNVNKNDYSKYTEFSIVTRNQAYIKKIRRASFVYSN